MKKNIGTLDKAFRLILAIIFVMLYFTNIVTGIPGIILLVIAIVFVLTSLIGFCPLYLIFDINTSPKDKC